MPGETTLKFRWAFEGVKSILKFQEIKICTPTVKLKLVIPVVPRCAKARQNLVAPSGAERWQHAVEW